jgi:hypothetical protein
MSWDTFHEGVLLASRLNLPVENIGQIRALSKIRRSFPVKRLPLLELWRKFRTFHATDGRDRVYALGISLDSGPDGLNVMPDYSLDEDIVFRNVSIRHLLQYRTLDIFKMPRLQEEIAMPHLPSWVPSGRNFLSHVISPHSFSDSFPVVEKGYELTARLAAAPSTTFHATDISSDKMSIRLYGFILASITRISEKDSVFRTEADLMGLALWFGRVQIMKSSWFRLANFENSDIYAPTEESMKDAYWQTVTAGYSGTGPYASNAIKRGFEIWYDFYQKPIRHMPSFGYFSLLRLLVSTVRVTRQDISPPSKSKDVEAYRQAGAMVAGRRLFRTTEGYLGLGPPGAQKGDKVFLLKGCKTPMVLRQTSKKDRWTLIGGSYVHGVMQGQMWNEEECHEVWLD